MAGQLTALGIGKLRTPGKYYDGAHGLFLQVYPSGAKCWQQRLTVSPGRRRTLGLGGYPAVGLADVRAAACKNWLLLRDGGDPCASTRSQVKTVPTFEEAAAAVIEQNAPTWTDPKHPKDWRNTLARYVFPCFGKVLVSQIDIDHVLEALKPIWHTHRETARRVRQRIRAIMDWAIAKGYRTDNPAGPSIHGVLAKRRSGDDQKRHHPAVPYSEVPQVIVAARGLTSRLPLRLLFEFVVLTAVRSGEGREAQWSEFDFDTATWFIPGSRMKMGFPHRVPLSTRVLEILREMRELDTRTGLVFPGVKPGRPFSDSAMLGLLRRQGSPGTVHGFRSSFRDWVAETGAATDMAAERALAHASINQTVDAYLRTDLLEARRPLMQRWADHVTSAAPA